MRNPQAEDNQLKWKSLVEQQRHSGLSVKKWCQQNQIRPTTFQYWKDKLAPKQLQKSNFTELTIACSDAISLETRGLYIRIKRDCSPDVRKKLFALFAEVSC